MILKDITPFSTSYLGEKFKKLLFLNRFFTRLRLMRSTCWAGKKSEILLVISCRGFENAYLVDLNR